MKKRNKIGLISVGLIAALFAMSGCTANFCTEEEKSRIAYILEPGVTEYYSSAELNEKQIEITETLQLNSNDIYKVVRKNNDGFVRSAQLNTIISAVNEKGIRTPSDKYFERLDEMVFDKVIEVANLTESFSAGNLSIDTLRSALKEYGSVKYYLSESNSAWGSYKNYNTELREELGYTDAASIDFENAYISSMDALVDTYRSCITTYDQVEYGNFGADFYDAEKTVTVKLDKVTWGAAWDKGGHLIEGLIVYPVAWMVDSFARLFAGGKSASAETISAQYATGVPQLISLILVTVIVRLFIFLTTIKSTLSQKKMTDLQPELAKIQQKYPNANTNQTQKQRLAEEQMRLYKKHKINPLSQLLVLVIQFPVFIGVWGAMTGSAVLSTGKVLGLELSSSIWGILKLGPKIGMGWWSALILILLMSTSQFFSMKVPQWIQKAKASKVARLGTNPAQKSQNKTANIISYAMLAMIIVMGFTLPAAMGVYWFIGALVSLLQTVLTNFVFVGKKQRK